SIWINWLAFQYFSNENYFVWYLKNGTLIGILVSFVALIWEGLSFRNDLLSARSDDHGHLALQAIWGDTPAPWDRLDFTAFKDRWMLFTNNNQI
ncbi:MAG: hypothetical protein WAN36_06620, partial [Calditrichia bacterium]